MLGRLTRRPVFATYQGAQDGHSPWERPVRRLAMRWCQGVIVGSAVERERVRARYRMPAEKLAPIPNPLDVRRWGPGDQNEAREALGLPLERRIVVWHGRVQVERKGLDVLLGAWRLLSAARPDQPPLLLLVGSGRDAEELRRRLRDPALGGVIWVDEYVQDRDRLWRYLAAADVSTLPSRHEGFALAVLEAMACGLPVVAADVSGVRDLLEASAGVETGIVVPPDDAGALAAALGLLIDDPDRSRRLGAAARAVAGSFSLERVGKQLAAVLVPGPGR